MNIKYCFSRYAFKNNCALLFWPFYSNKLSKENLEKLFRYVLFLQNNAQFKVRMTETAPYSLDLTFEIHIFSQLIGV